MRIAAVTGRCTSELRVVNRGSALGRDVAVSFPNLPAGVSLLNRSGATSTGAPYLNLRDAIARGELVGGGRSEAVVLEFDNPTNLPLALYPQTLAGVNQPPELAPLGPFTVMAGDVLAVDLQATDADGDTLQYLLDFDAPLPTSTLGSDGRLVVRPGPDDVGTYPFTAIVSDGSHESQVPVTLHVVADPIWFRGGNRPISVCSRRCPPCAIIPSSHWVRVSGTFQIAMETVTSVCLAR